MSTVRNDRQKNNRATAAMGGQAGRRRRTDPDRGASAALPHNPTGHSEELSSHVRVERRRLERARGPMSARNSSGPISNEGQP